MNSQNLHDYVVAHFNTEAWKEIPTTRLCIVVDGQPVLQVEAAQTGLALLGASTPVNFHIYFVDMETALAVLSDPRLAIDAFMQGRFRSSGYIMRTFAFLRACARTD